MDYQTLNYEFSENIATITLNRPDNSANALNAQMTDLRQLRRNMENFDTMLAEIERF